MYILSETNIPDPIISIPRKIIHFLANPEITCQVVFVTKEKHHDENIVKLQYMDLDIDSIDRIVKECIQFIKHRENWKYANYGKDRDAKLVEKYNIEDMKNIPNTKIYLGQPNDKITSLEDGFVRSLKSIQFRFQTRRKTIIFFRKFTQQKILSHGKGTWKAMSGILTLNKDHIIEVPRDYDCCKYENNMIIFHPDNFEDLFDYHEIHAEVHREVFEYLENDTDYKIKNIDALRELALNHPQKLRKLPSIKEKEIYKWSFKQIKAFLKKRPTSTVSIDLKKKLVTFKNVYAMIHFFNDAHLDSKATDTSYLAQSKSVET